MRLKSLSTQVVYCSFINNAASCEAVILVQFISPPVIVKRFLFCAHYFCIGLFRNEVRSYSGHLITANPPSGRWRFCWVIHVSFKSSLTCSPLWNSSQFFTFLECCGTPLITGPLFCLLEAFQFQFFLFMELLHTFNLFIAIWMIFQLLYLIKDCTYKHAPASPGIPF